MHFEYLLVGYLLIVADIDSERYDGYVIKESYWWLCCGLVTVYTILDKMLLKNSLRKINSDFERSYLRLLVTWLFFLFLLYVWGWTSVLVVDNVMTWKVILVFFLISIFLSFSIVILSYFLPVREVILKILNYLITMII